MYLYSTQRSPPAPLYQSSAVPLLYEGKCYLRKASATQGEYVRLAQELGIDGGDFDLREWNAQEGVNYLVRPVVVNELKTS